MILMGKNTHGSWMLLLSIFSQKLKINPMNPQDMAKA
jgi:hypothetical protein